MARFTCDAIRYLSARLVQNNLSSPALRKAMTAVLLAGRRMTRIWDAVALIRKHLLHPQHQPMMCPPEERDERLINTFTMPTKFLIIAKGLREDEEQRTRSPTMCRRPSASESSRSGLTWK